MKFILTLEIFIFFHMCALLSRNQVACQMTNDIVSLTDRKMLREYVSDDQRILALEQ